MTISPYSRLAALALFLLASACALATDAPGRWISSWASAQQLTEPHNLPPEPGLAGQTLRQIVRPTLGGSQVRITLSNAFGEGPVTVVSAGLAPSTGESAVQPDRHRALTFNGAASVVILPGTSVVSDAVPFTVTAGENLAISLQFGAVPANVTGHPGSRTTSFIQEGDGVSAPALPAARRTDHWYFLSSLEAWADPSAAALVVLGDSITDGRGSTTNQNDRWPDNLSRRLLAQPATAQIAVLNQGAGGGRVLRDGLGLSALARFDRDVLAHAGVRWLVILEGVNDLGTAVGARARGESAATAQDLIDAYVQMIRRAHAHGIRVYGGTIMPFEGFSAYFTPESEADRQTVNAWIRTSGAFDAVIDFDAIARDPTHPARLSATVDGGDHLHLSAAGYRIIADAIDLSLFDPAVGPR